ncbi:MAG TPA: choice-of-anchor D domain-containing protein [Kiritimatiellia bacterium]|nr:choice-of-anchor D domain-containing protein [Kiritimatiellia bacterium]
MKTPSRHSVIPPPTYPQRLPLWSLFLFSSLWLVPVAPSLGGLVIAGGGLTLAEEGGTFQTGNVATTGVAFAQNEIGIAPHTIAGVNDGVYGNASSWIGGTANSFIGISLGATPVPLYKVAFGRDNLSNFTDRALGVYTLQYTTVAHPDANTPEGSWTTIGSLDYQSAGGTNFTEPALRHAFTFDPVDATGFRIKTASATDAIAIDEIELYRRGLTVAGLRLVAEGGAFFPNNLASGGVAFAKDALSTPPHTIGGVNDGVYGNNSSWIAGSSNSFIGINLGTSPVAVARIAFGRDNNGLLADRVYSTYTVQYTTVADPDETTPDEQWTTIGSTTYTEPGGPLFASPALRHVFAFAPVSATGVRLVIDGALDIDSLIAIDELELYGPSQLRLEHPLGVARTMPTRITAWGNNDFNQNQVPTNLFNPTAVEAGNSLIAALTTNGAYTAWGNNAFNLLNDPFGLTGIHAIAAGAAHHLLIRADGSVVGFGTDQFGETITPVTLDGVPVRAIAAGERVSLAVAEDGRVFGWGELASDILPVPTNLTDVVAIECGAHHAIALRRDGTVAAWGSNTELQTDIPAGLSNVVAIAAGTFHNLAVRRDGTVVAWGLNDQGQRNVPAGLSNVTDVAAGRWHSMARRSDGSVVLWGGNTSGQLDTPVGVAYVRSISANRMNSAALHAVPLTLEFVPVNPTNAATRVITLFNDGPGPLHIRRITLDGGNGFSLDTAALSNDLPAGASTSFSVAFLPPGTSTVEVALLVETDDPHNPVFEAALIGNAVDTTPPVISLPATNIAVLATNIAGAIVTFDVGIADNADNDPVVNITPPSGSLFPPGMTTVSVSAVDFAANTSTASFVVSVTLPSPVRIETGGAFAPDNLAFSGTPFAKDEAFFPTHRIVAVNDGFYGNTSSWIGVTTDSFIGINLGATPVPVEQIAFGRDNNGFITDRANGTYTLQFTTTPNPNAATPDSAWTSFGPITYPGASPFPARRNRFAFLPVEATGIRLVIQTSLQVAIDEIELYGYNPSANLILEEPVNTALVSGSSTNDFGAHEAGATGPTRVYTARNTGDAVLTFSSIAMTGSNSADFVITPASGWANVPPGTSMTFSVTFQPQGVGPRAATLLVNNSSSNEPAFTVALTGISEDTTPPVIAPLTNLTTYITAGTGAVVQFSQPSASDNSGLAPVVTTDPASGAFFPLGTNAITVIATDSVGNASTGKYSLIVLPRALITLEAPVNSVLTGTPPAYAFGTLTVGSSNTQAFTIFNDGLRALAISGISVIGTHPADYGLDASGLDTNIATGGNSTFDVTFAPRAHGTRTATVRLVTDDPVTPFYDLLLTGDGVDITPPVITPPTNFTVFSGASTNGVRVLYPPIGITDNAINPVNVIVDPPNASLMLAGTNLVTILATDAGSNASTATFEVVVMPSVYPPEVPVGGAVPFNLALGRTAFGANFIGNPHTIATVNNGLYGNTNGWIAATINSFVGINLGATPVAVNHVAFSRDHRGVFIDRTPGTYTVQFTTTPNPNAATPDLAWQTIGSVTYTLDFADRGRRNVYAFPSVAATGIRLLTAASEFPVGIDEVEIYGTPSVLSVEHPAGVALTSGVSTITFAPRDLTTPSAPNTVTLGNPGPDPIRITGISVTNNQTDNFILTPPNLVTTLAAGASTTLQVVFQPSALGPRETTLRVRVENATFAAFDVALAGTGVDVSAPVIVTPGDITVFIPLNETNAVVTYPPAQVSDNSGFPADVTYSHPSGSVFPLGITPVTITAVDPSSNTSTATFAIGVQYEPTLSLEVIEGNPFVQKNIVQAWGATFIGLPMPSNLPSATAVSLGYQHGLILLEDGTVVAWGDDSAGQRTVPAGLSNVIAIAAGAWHSLAITADGTVTAWGKHEPDILKPPVVVPPGLTGVVQVSGGYYMSAARLANGSIVVWGGNQQGQLTVPPGLTNVIDISCSTDHCLAALTDGTVVAWGDNEFGKLNVPAGLSNVIQVTAGRNASVALRADGTAVGWGRNAANEYGGLSGATNLMEVQTGLEHTVARRADGTLLVSGTPGSPQVTGAAGLEDALSIGSAQSLTAAAVVKNWPVITFDTISLGTRVTNTFILRNTGPGPLNVTNFILVGTNTNQFQVDTSATIMPLASGATTTVSVIYNPTGPLGVRTATLRLYSNDQDVPLWKVRLTAEATDDEAPVFPSLEDLIAYASDTGGVRVLLQPLAVDNSGLPPAITVTPPTTTKFLPGTNPVTVVATDASGNAATGAFHVIVRVTSTPPVVGPSDPVPPNLARGKTPFAQNVLPFFPHSIPALNDGVYGNNSSWIGSTVNSFAGINLGATPMLIDRIAFGRDNTGLQISRAEGTYTLQVTTTPNPTAATPDNAWQTIGVVVNPGLLDVLHRRNLFAFKPVFATGVRILVATTGPEIGIDEIELYAPPTPFAAWQSVNFSAGELLNPAISGPLADPGTSGVANLYRYATGLDRDDDPQPALPRLQSLQFIYRRLLDPESGVAYDVQISTNLLNAAAWRGIEIADGITEASTSPNPDGITEDVRMSIPPGAITPTLNLRLKVTPEE